MAFSYKPLWCMLADKGISKTVFREKLNLSTATLAKLSSDKPVSSEILARICEFFGCRLEDIVVYVSDMEQFFINISEEILGYEYTIYIDKWPECKIQLKKQHFDYLNRLSDIEWKNLIFSAEQLANSKHFPNAGIIGTTKVKMDTREQLLIINGSFAVTEEIMLWIIEHIK